MKKHILLLLLLLIIPSITAQEPIESFNNYKSLELAFKLTSGINIAPTGGKQQIESIQTDLSFFPRNDAMQDVLSFNAEAQPTAKIATKEKYTTYLWRDVQTNELDFSVDAVVKTTNGLSRIRRPVTFPIKTIDDSLLQYTKPTKFIDVTPAIEKQAYDIIGGETDFYKVVFKLADWTRNNINYDLNTLTADAVQKSSWVLENKEGVCDEMTNLFISFLRSVGIPARFVSGMVYTNLDYTWGPHGWAEMYFPEYGWIPFDVTFGQYGWLDPSHVKLKESLDSGSPSAEYTWRATGVELNLKELKPEASLVKKGAVVTSPLGISITPIKEHVGFGSFVPILVTIENKENYYVSSSIVIKKAPELTENNVKEVLLAPQEAKTIGWIATIPTNLEENYIYTGALEATTSFGDTATAKVTYAAEYPVYQQRNAEAILFNLNKREEKQQLTTLDITCTPNQELYYTNETVTITCDLRNRGEATAAIKTCLRELCNDVTLPPGEKTTTTFETTLATSGRIPITAEDESGVVSTYINLNKVKIPEVYVSDITPDVFKYKEEVSLSFKINTDVEIKQVKLQFPFGEQHLETFEGSRTITITTDGRSLKRGLRFTVSFVDEKGKPYTQNLAVPVKVTHVPWYAKMVFWILGIF